MTSAAGLDRSQHLDRIRARAWALQVHYRWESSGREGTLREALMDTMATRRVSPRRVPQVRNLMSALDDHGPEIDAALQRALQNWRLDRLAAMDRAVLRIGAAELLYDDEIPPKVSIQEAIRLAEAYGGDESPRFVNGVLDALYKQIPEPADEPRGPDEA